jgi:3'-5' exoribonuclease
MSQTAAPAARRCVQTLADGENIEEVYLVVEKQLRANRNGNLFLQLELRDRTGSISGRLWNAGEPLFKSFEAGDFVLIKGKVQLFQGGLQIILNHVARVAPETIDLAEYLPHTEHDVNKLYERLRTLLRKVGNPHLRALADCFLMDDGFTQGLCKAPAGVRQHHAYIGGLLEHVVTMLDVADRITPLYPDLDRDLFLMGVFLHDIGKIRELSYSRSFAYTDEGQLLGHLVIGVEMVSQMAARAATLTGTPFPPELLLRLKHLIVSHHGMLEFGSPRVPMTVEAIALHYLDNFDAKLNTFTREIKDDPNPGSAWTPFNQSLDRRLYKGLPNKAGDAADDED